MNDNIIEELKVALEMAEDQVSTCERYNLKSEEFFPFMVGWMSATIRNTLSNIEMG